jgi:large subunit ribosomal protein L30
MAKLCVKWVKSDIGYPRDQRRTLRALGLHRLNQRIEQEDSPSLRGMLAKVGNLIQVERCDNDEPG